MDWAFTEKLASRQTGRTAAPTLESGGGRLVVYPANLIYRELLPACGDGQFSDTYFLKYASGLGSQPLDRVGYLRFIFSLLKILPLCLQVDLHLIAVRGGALYVMTAVIAARLFGIAISLHDYRFKSGREGKLSSLIYPLCRRLEMGDISAVSGGMNFRPDLVFRNDLIDPARYLKYAKDRAIPRVILYGDFEEPKTISLAKRTHELVKQKYPRAEFIMASFTSSTKNLNLPVNSDQSLYTAAIENDGSLERLFEKADSVMLLSPGGLNRSFRMRARAAGYPVIINGFECAGSDSDVISVTRDSYSRLADAVIGLVDDDDYYRSFSPK